jgi:hypothetical protein
MLSICSDYDPFAYFQVRQANDTWIFLMLLCLLFGVIFWLKWAWVQIFGLDIFLQCFCS